MSPHKRLLGQKSRLRRNDVSAEVGRRYAFGAVMLPQELCLRSSDASAGVIAWEELHVRRNHALVRCYASPRAMPSEE